jgi:isocitrate/isopropylmalate dehydrogenase
MPNKTPITVAHGDGIGPEIMGATPQILDAAGAALEIETKVFLSLRGFDGKAGFTLAQGQ